MELLGIALSIPIACVASMLYCLFLVRVVLKFERTCRWLRFVSYLILAFIATELLLLVTLGAVHGRGLIGPGF